MAIVYIPDKWAEKIVMKTQSEFKTFALRAVMKLAKEELGLDLKGVTANNMEIPEETSKPPKVSLFKDVRRVSGAAE